MTIDTIGPVIAGNLMEYFKDEDNNRRLDHLMSYLHIQKEDRKRNRFLRDEFCDHRKSGAFRKPQ